MFPGDISCDISIRCVFGAMEWMTPFTMPTYGSLRPKSVRKAIMVTCPHDVL